MADIVLDHVTKRFADGSLAVDEANLEIADGEFIILVGPSGCGKSTTLNMIAGLEDITSGELRIGGKVVNGLAPKDRDIAMVFQSYALYPHMTVRQNMGFALSLAKVPKPEIARKVAEAAEILDLTDHLDRKPANLSGGQRQRVAMGRAIVRSPQAFLMDEPLSNLDAKLRVQTRTQVSRLQNRLGTTMVYVTHDQTEAMTLGDRVAVLRAGRIQQVASPAELYERPVNIFVAGFIGSPAMNFLPVSWDGEALHTPVGKVVVDDRVRRVLDGNPGDGSHVAAEPVAGTAGSGPAGGPAPDSPGSADSAVSPDSPGSAREADSPRADSPRAAGPAGAGRSDGSADTSTGGPAAARGRGRDLILGIRPEHFEDATIIGPDRPGLRFGVTADVVESLGSDKFAYFTVAGGAARVSHLEEILHDAGTADVPGGGEQVVVRLDAASPIREGEKVELWMDTERIHLFDPDSGGNLTL